MSNQILVDGRWQGSHGIGRFSGEIISRLTNIDVLQHGPHPLSMRNLIWQNAYLAKKQPYKLFYTPGFNPPSVSSIPFAFTIHDLIHLHVPGKAAFLKELFYSTVIKQAAKQAAGIITVSNYSKQAILDWIKLPSEKITVVDSGISPIFTAAGAAYQPGFPYLLHVANNKAHKNPLRLIQAFGVADIDSDIKLICTYPFTPEISRTVEHYQLESRVISNCHLTEQQLAEYYRGALGVVFPSLIEGFGLPVLEGMASGTPVLTSNMTSLPEIAGDAALLIDPYNTNEIAYGIEQLIKNATQRKQLIERGFARCQHYSWDKTAHKIQQTLNQLIQD